MIPNEAAVQLLEAQFKSIQHIEAIMRVQWYAVLFVLIFAIILTIRRAG